jgi:hypothetical protein
VFARPLCTIPLHSLSFRDRPAEEGGANKKLPPVT